MPFHLDEALLLLERTPAVLESWLGDFPDAWTRATEGPDTWSPYDVVGHLVHGEKTDWLTRVEIILAAQPERRFQPFDRFAHLRDNEGKPLTELLAEFRELRLTNIRRVRALRLDEAALDRTGIHPTFGEVTLRQLLATWTAHDLDHVQQIARVMAFQLKVDVGPWVAFLRIVREPIARLQTARNDSRGG